VGYLPIDSREEYLFFQSVSYNYERSSSLITSNKSFGYRQELFGEQMIAMAILDRLLHHFRVNNIKGHSYRLRSHKLPKSDFTMAGSFGPTVGDERTESL
jgi:DNA replication protein DnaC